MAKRFRPRPEVASYYAGFPEEARLASGRSRLERERTRELLLRELPEPPARVVDVGGAAGAYSFWLASRGYRVELVDAAPRLIELAQRRDRRATRKLAAIAVADARALPQRSGSADVVLVMGPLYHLTSARDRQLALREARRVLRRGGMLVAAAISRYASALDGFARELTRDRRFRAIRNRDLRDGQHRNPVGERAYFTTAFFHLPEQLRDEIAAAGFREARVLGVEGPGWLASDFDVRWRSPRSRRDLIELARRLESERSIVGVSAHLLAIARRE